MTRRAAGNVATRLLLFALALPFFISKGQAEGNDASGPATSAIAGNAVGAAAASTDIILVSVPDAGGLRLVYTADKKILTHVAGRDLPPTPVIPGPQAFTKDASGYVNGGSAKFSADHKITNLFGTGLDLKIKAQSKVAFDATTGSITFDKDSGSGGIVLMLPIKDQNGNKTEVDISPFSIDKTGKFSIDASVVPPSPLTVNLPVGIAISVPEITVAYAHNPGGTDDDATITLGNPPQANGMPAANPVAAKFVSISAPIPGVLCKDAAPLKLTVASASVNTDGQVSFSGANLSTAALARTKTYQVASRKAGKRDVALPASAFPYTIKLMKPADFNIVLKDSSAVSLTMKDNVPTGMTIKCDVELPSSFTTTEGGSDRVTARGVTLDIGTNGFIADNISIDKAFFKGFGVTIHKAVLDLSETKSGVPTGGTAPAGGVSWEGFYISDATFSLPSDMILADDSGDVGKAPDLKMTNCWIDNSGFTGGVALVGDENTSKGSLLVDSFFVHLNDLKVDVQRNSIKDAAIDGYIKIDSLGSAPITVAASVADSGMATMQVKTGTLNIDKFNAQMQIDNGTFTHDANGKMQLALSGTWSFTDQADDALKGLKVQVKDLDIGSDGQFALDSVWIDMPASANLDFDVVTLEARKIGFGGIGPGKTPWVGFNGSVGIGSDLPIQVDADFEGLYIYASSPDYPHGDVHVGKISVDCDVEDIIHVDGYIEQTEGTMTRSVITDGATKTGAGVDPNGHPSSNINKNPGEGGGYFLNNDSKVDAAKLTFPGVNGQPGKPLKILSGAVSIELPILSGPDGGSGPGGSIEFMIARNCWYAMGDFNAGGDPLILLGDTGFAIYGFGGGVGYNVKPEFDGATGIPNRDYQVIPDIQAILGNKPTPTGLPNIIALASVRMGVVTPPATPSPLWGDVTLAVDIANLIVSLQGNVYLACEMPTDIPAIPTTLDRFLSATLTFDGPTKTFTAKGTADFCIPSREYVKDPSDPTGKKNKLDANGNPIDNTLLHLYAPFTFKIGQYSAATDAGWDHTNNKVFYAALGGPVDLGSESTENGVTAHRNVTIANPVTLAIRGLPNPVQAAVTLDANSGTFLSAMKIHEAYHKDSGDQKYNVTICDVHVATIKYRYTLDAEFDMIGWAQAKFPGIDSSAFHGLNASGEFYLNASLSGKATDLNVDPAWGWSFGLPDIGLTAVLEADLYASVSTNPNAMEIRGQVYADLGFTVDGHSLSLPISEGVDWKYN